MATNGWHDHPEAADGFHVTGIDAVVFAVGNAPHAEGGGVVMRGLAGVAHREDNRVDTGDVETVRRFQVIVPAVGRHRPLLRAAAPAAPLRAVVR